MFYGKIAKRNNTMVTITIILAVVLIQKFPDNTRMTKIKTESSPDTVVSGISRDTKSVSTRSTVSTGIG